jgi:hypothetical protein
LESHQVLEKITSYELLRDRRPALREDQRTILRILPSQSYQACRQRSNPDFAQYPGKYGVVDSAMREKVLVLGGEDRITNNGRDVFMPDDLPVLFCQLNKRLAVGVVDVADRRKLEAGEGSYVRQVGSVKIDVMESDCKEGGRNEYCADK